MRGKEKGARNAKAKIKKKTKRKNKYYNRETDGKIIADVIGQEKEIREEEENDDDEGGKQQRKTKPR